MSGARPLVNLLPGCTEMSTVCILLKLVIYEGEESRLERKKVNTHFFYFYFYFFNGRLTQAFKFQQRFVGPAVDEGMFINPTTKKWLITDKQNQRSLGFDKTERLGSDTMKQLKKTRDLEKLC